ncbi:MAG: multidrug effflux MFS transporter [Paracoccaceae bacterium]
MSSPRPPVRFLDRRTPPHIATLVLITGVAALSLNIFLPSLTSMAAYFRADYALVQLSVSLYLAITGVLQIFVGPVSDRFGRRPVLIAALAVFILATIGAMLAPNIWLFLACRLAQASIATAFVLGRAIVRDMVGQEEAASMIGYVTMGMSVVPMIGPMIGGMLDEAFGWQASFGMLLAGGIAALVLVWRDLGETSAGRPSSFREQLGHYPALLRSQRFWGYCLASAFASGVFFAYLGGAPFVGETVFHLKPATLGFYFGAPALGYAIDNFIAGRFSERVGVNHMVLWGALLTTGGLSVLALLLLSGISNAPTFFGFVTFVGLGNGMALPNATAGMLSVRPQLAGSASGLGGAMAIGGGAAMSALATALLRPGSGPMPLLVLMILCSLASVAAILWVMRRARAIGL